MEKQRLISSYDEINDTFVGKVDGNNGYVADYSITDGVFLGVDNYNLPTSVFISNATEVLDTSKTVLESPDVKIGINCDDVFLTFTICIENLLIFSARCENSFNIPAMDYLIDCNI